MFRRWTDECQIMFFNDLRKMGVFGQKTVSGMDRIGAGDLASGDQGRNVQIGLGAGRWADADAFVSKPNMHGVDVSGRMRRNSLNTHFAACALDAQCNLTPIGDQNL